MGEWMDGQIEGWEIANSLEFIHYMDKIKMGGGAPTY